MYECPNCGQNLKFDIARQQMHCDYCDTVMDPYAITEKHSAREVVDPAYTGTNAAKIDEAANAKPIETMQVHIYTCPQCGGEIVGDVNEAMVFCSFCGASTPLNERMTNIRRPEIIIPFKKTKEDCAREYKKLLTKAMFAPKELKDPKNISGFRAIYMPYWVYDFTRNAAITYSGKHCYHRGNYDYTDHYKVTTNVSMQYNGVNYDASSSFSDNLSQAISPYEAKEAKPFTTAFMSGFYADTMDVEPSVYEKEAKDIVCDHAADAIMQQQRSSKYTVEKESVKKALDPRTNKSVLAMFPVWFMSYKTTDKKGKERVLYSVINGQTGKAAADIPVDIRKYVIGSLILAIPLFIVFNMFLQLRPMFLSIAAAVISIICMISLYAQSSQIAAKEMGSDDAGLSSINKRNKEYKQALKTREKWEAKSIWKANAAFFFVPIILCALLILFKPVHDAYYYVTVIISGVCDCFMLTDIMRRYNKLATRPLPQFKKKGGDDSANITGNI